MSMEETGIREQVDQTSAALVMTAMSFAVLALAFSSIFITHLEHAEVSPLVIAFYRMAMATILLFPAALTAKRKEMAAFSGKEYLLLGLGGFFLALHFGAWI